MAQQPTTITEKSLYSIALSLKKLVEKTTGETIGPRDPRDRWCTAKTNGGTRCIHDSVKDGLCIMHWRKKNG